MSSSLLRSVAVTLAMGSLLSACRSTEKAGAAAAKDGHIAHSQTLADLMAELDQNAVARLSEDIESAQNQAAQYDRVAASAAALEQSAKKLEAHAPHLRLTTVEQDRFMMLAGQMAVEARRLADYASSPRPGADATEARYDKILVICNECHSSFRVLPKLHGVRHAAK